MKAADIPLDRRGTMGETLSKESSEAQFQNWLAHMDDAIEEFLARLPGEVRAHLDGRPSRSTCSKPGSWSDT
jgi:hypothetical protein